MRRLMNVVVSGRIDLGVMVTHQYKLENIVDAYDLFANQRDGVLKIAIKPRIWHIPLAGAPANKGKPPRASRLWWTGSRYDQTQ